MLCSEMTSGYYVVEGKRTASKTIVQVHDGLVRFFGTKRIPVDEMDEQYTVIEQLDLPYEETTAAVRSS